MMTQSLYIVNCFLSCVLSEFICYIIYIAGIHQILPYNQTFLIAKVIEFIAWIVTAAPYTNTVKIRSLT